MDKFKVVIAGGRTFNNYALLKFKLDKVLIEKASTHHIVIVSGGARGADSLGEVYAKKKGYEIEKFLPDWDKYGKRAGMLRNNEMIKACDAVVAFWDGVSKGTKYMVENCNCPLRVIKYQGESYSIILIGYNVSCLLVYLNDEIEDSKEDN